MSQSNNRVVIPISGKVPDEFQTFKTDTMGRCLEIQALGFAIDELLSQIEIQDVSTSSAMLLAGLVEKLAGELQESIDSTFLEKEVRHA